MPRYYTQKEMADKCQDNDWLRYGALEDTFMEEYDYPFCLKHCDTLEELEREIGRGNWAIRQGFAYDRLLFVNQVNGGDEWWTCYKHDDGRIQSFESITFRWFIEKGEFNNLIMRLLQGPDAYYGE